MQHVSGHILNTLRGSRTEAAIDLSIERITALSRSFRGESNTDVSACKEPFIVPADEVSQRVIANFRLAVSRFSTLGPRDLRVGQDAEVVLLDIARTVNEGLHPDKRPLLRTWETGLLGHAALVELRDSYDRFCGEFAQEWPFSFRDPAPFGAWIEWTANARGHFWYDGCGRITRAAAVTALSRAELAYPQFESRAEYFELISQPLASWTKTYAMRVGRLIER